LGIVGLAISATLGNLVQCLGLFYLYYRRVDGHSWKVFYLKIAKITIASIFMSSITWTLFRLFDNTLLDTSRTIPLLILFSITSIIGLLVYLFVSKLLKIEELEDFSRLLKIKLL
jgi:peptidoglycan biosynthesis protein MviN/MurJ (putative lipid II flippase)